MIAKNMMDGARLAVSLGFLMMITNGVVARLNPSKQTLQEIVVSRTLGITSGVSA